jgi:hypothetical protein
VQSMCRPAGRDHTRVGQRSWEINGLVSDAGHWAARSRRRHGDRVLPQEKKPGGNACASPRRGVLLVICSFPGPNLSPSPFQNQPRHVQRKKSTRPHPTSFLQKPEQGLLQVISPWRAQHQRIGYGDPGVLPQPALLAGEGERGIAGAAPERFWRAEDGVHLCGSLLTASEASPAPPGAI